MPARITNTISHRVEQFRWQLPYAVASALTKTAQLVKDAEKETMRQVFDRPTPFTMNSLQLTPAKKDRPVAVVWFKDPPNLSQKQHYLEPEVFGGGRAMKPFEMGMGGKQYVMPSKYEQLDAYGNLGRGKLTKLLSIKGGFRESGFQMNATAAKKMREYLVLQQRRGKLPPGIYERTNGAEAGGRMGRYMLARNMKGVKRSELNARYRQMYPRGLHPVVVFTEAKPSYSKRFPFYEVAERVARANLQRLITEELNRMSSYAGKPR